jgi:hypothetical protein
MNDFVCNFGADVQSVLDKITYKQCEFILVCNDDAKRWSLKFKTQETCNYTGNLIPLTVAYTRPFKLPVTSAQVIKIAMNLILWWENHEALERFTYDGKLLFNPHQPKTHIAEQIFPELDYEQTPFSVVEYE